MKKNILVGIVELNKGAKLGRALAEAMIAIAKTDARVSENGDVEFSEDLVRELTFKSGAVRQRFDDLFDVLWPQVKDQATHAKRVEWQRRGKKASGRNIKKAREDESRAQIQTTINN